MNRRVLVRPLHLNDITGEIVDAAMKVHSVLGPVFWRVLTRHVVHKLRSRPPTVCLEVTVPMLYEGHIIRKAYRIDELVEEAVVVELKARRKLRLIDDAQIISQLKLCKYRCGLMIDFHVRRLKDGIHRYIN